MFRMNRQDFCSRQILSTYIHVGNDAVPWMARSVASPEWQRYVFTSNPEKPYKKTEAITHLRISTLAHP